MQYKSYNSYRSLKSKSKQRSSWDLSLRSRRLSLGSTRSSSRGYIRRLLLGRRGNHLVVRLHRELDAQVHRTRKVPMEEYGRVVAVSDVAVFKYLARRRVRSLVVQNLTPRQQKVRIISSSS